MSTTPQEPVFFGQFEVTEQVFLKTGHSFAIVNLKPLLPGHVLVCPRVPHKRLTELPETEISDLFATVQRVQRMLARRYFPPAAPAPAPASDSSSSTAPEPGGSFTIAVQDGPEAGQTVAHVHVHVLPRVRGTAGAKADPNDGDAVYENLAAEAGNVGGALWDRAVAEALARVMAAAGSSSSSGGGGGGGGRPRPGGAFGRIEDAQRSARQADDMAAEAAEYRALLRDMEGREPVE